MRDGCVSSLDTSNGERSLGDMFNMSSLFVRDGRYDSYDPHGRAFMREFGTKVCITLTLSFVVTCTPLLDRLFFSIDQDRMVFGAENTSELQNGSTLQSMNRPYVSR